jgi:sulfonate transport system permease protein
MFRRIIFPAALPSVLVGMRLGLGYSWRALVGAELIAAASGIGYMILDAEQLSRPDIILIGIFTIGIVGTVIDGLFFRLTTRLIPWQIATEADYGRG